MITFCIPNQPILYFKGIWHDSPPCLISVLQAYRLIQTVCCCYLLYVKEYSDQEINLNEILVVREFLDVFLDDLPGLPPKGKGEFAIDLVLGTPLVSKPSYRMALLKLVEFK